MIQAPENMPRAALNTSHMLACAEIAPLVDVMDTLDPIANNGDSGSACGWVYLETGNWMAQEYLRPGCSGVTL